ncbi:hypothetical protein L873DRAFT_84515 [Choiromyces venosus 120613-1]|uniref:Uncharacterized protein n=1 Tax=Choiromyces venosus 120613-1 TaxID=1336337 RepID=A0A3N4J851_9PEZI|nr:hypothetical protein L873DRAFT_84515 [Choiromyces venosus 120613-1]
MFICCAPGKTLDLYHGCCYPLGFRFFLLLLFYVSSLTFVSCFSSLRMCSTVQCSRVLSREAGGGYLSYAWATLKTTVARLFLFLPSIIFVHHRVFAEVVYQSAVISPQWAIALFYIHK